MSDKRHVRFNGDKLGEFTIDKLYLMRTRGDLDGNVEFLSERTSPNQWLTLAGIIDDLETTQTTAKKVKEFKEMGFKQVRFAGTAEDCPSCAEIAATVYLIDKVPTIPPQDCTCNPWCRLFVMVVAGD